MIETFTGIVEELGKINKIDRGSQSCQISVFANKVVSDVNIGDSIAINGVCLTVIKFDQQQFSADVMDETLKKTNLNDLKSGSIVNLERALRLGDRMGGHLVQGHIDGIGTILEMQRMDIAILIKIKAAPEVMRYMVPKGSVAIDGISLTVIDVLADSFTVSLIPHTAHMTSLGFKKPGDSVNLESDIIGRYVERLLVGSSGTTRSDMTLSFLADHGFA